jgi:molybdopterin molybdotransferase
MMATVPAGGEGSAAAPAAPAAGPGGRGGPAAGASLADFLGGVLRQLRPVPPLDLDLTQASGNVLAEDVPAPHGWPSFDCAELDGYAVRLGDAPAPRPGLRLSVIGDLTAASWRPVRLTPGSCFSAAAGAALPGGADTVVPAEWTDQGLAAVELRRIPRRGYGVRRAGSELAAGTVLARAGAAVTPAMLAGFAAAGVAHVVVRPSPRVAVVATGDELVDPGRVSQPGQVVDVSSHALTAAATEGGGYAYRVGICDDDPELLRGLLEDQTLRADLIVTTGGTGTGPGDMVRRVLARRDGPRAGSVSFTELAVHPCGMLGFGTVGAEEVPIICLPGDPGAALVGFELLARPVLQVLAGAEPVFRPSVRGHLLAAVQSPAGRREFRPAQVSERRGGGYTVQPLPGGRHTLAGLAGANGLLVLGERVTTAPVGSNVDVLLLDRRR